MGCAGSRPEAPAAADPEDVAIVVLEHSPREYEPTGVESPSALEQLRQHNSMKRAEALLEEQKTIHENLRRGSEVRAEELRGKALAYSAVSALKQLTPRRGR